MYKQGWCIESNNTAAIGYSMKPMSTSKSDRFFANVNWILPTQIYMPRHTFTPLVRSAHIYILQPHLISFGSPFSIFKLYFFFHMLEQVRMLYRNNNINSHAFFCFFFSTLLFPFAPLSIDAAITARFYQ